MQVSPFDCMHGPAWSSQIYPAPKTSRPIITARECVWRVVGHELVGGDTPSMHTLGHTKRSHTMPICGGVEGKLAKEARQWRRENEPHSHSFPFYSRYALTLAGWSCSSFLELKGPFKKGGLTHPRTCTRTPYHVPSTSKKHEEGAHLITPLALNFHDASIAALFQPSFFAFHNLGKEIASWEKPMTWHYLLEICHLTCTCLHPCEQDLKVDNPYSVAFSLGWCVVRCRFKNGLKKK